MAILRESDRTFLRQFFEERLVNEVEVHLFVSKKDCEYCEETKELLTEVASLNPKIRLQVHDFELEKDVANSMGVDKVPATVIKSVNGTMVYYFGIPSGYEFRSFMEDLVDASRGSTDLSEEIRSQVKRINEPVEIKVFVTPTCPYCPRAVRTAHKFAFENPNIKALMIESLEFSELAQQYNVMAVPKIVINDKVEFEGAMPENFFIEQVFAALDQAY